MTSYQKWKLFLFYLLAIVAVSLSSSWIDIECLALDGQMVRGFFVDHCEPRP